MIEKLTLIRTQIVLELECGEKLPYTTLIPMYSFQLEDEVIVCDKPEPKPINHITPCKVLQAHLGMCERHPYAYTMERLKINVIVYHNIRGF